MFRVRVCVGCVEWTLTVCPQPQQRQLILSEARRANRRSVAVMSTSSQDTILQSSNSQPHAHPHFADVKSPRDPALMSAGSSATAAASNGAPANGGGSASKGGPFPPCAVRMCYAGVCCLSVVVVCVL